MDPAAAFSKWLADNGRTYTADSELGKLVFARFLLDVIERGLVHNSDPKQTYAIGVTSALDWQLRMEFDVAGSRRRSQEEAVGEPEGVTVQDRTQQLRGAHHLRNRRLVTQAVPQQAPPPVQRVPSPASKPSTKAPPPASPKNASASIYGALFDLGVEFAPTLDSVKSGTLPISRSAMCAAKTKDNRGALKPAQQQGSCGSCWAFGTTATVMAELYDGSTAPYLSTQELVDCVTSEPLYGSHTNKGCFGGSHVIAFEYMKNKGVGLEADYPYEMEDSVGVERHQCRATQDESRRVFISDYRLLTGGEDQMMEHLITVVGWGVQSGTPFWIIRNSWGANWGDPAYPGHVRMLRNANSPHTGDNGLAFLAQWPVRVYTERPNNPSPAEPAPQPEDPDQLDCRGSSAWKGAEQEARDGTKPGASWAVAVPITACSQAVTATNYETLEGAEEAALAKCSDAYGATRCQVVASGAGPSPDTPDTNPPPADTPHSPEEEANASPPAAADSNHTPPETDTADRRPPLADEWDDDSPPTGCLPSPPRQPAAGGLRLLKWSEVDRIRAQFVAPMVPRGRGGMPSALTCALLLALVPAMARTSRSLKGTMDDNERPTSGGAGPVDWLPIEEVKAQANQELLEMKKDPIAAFNKWLADNGRIYTADSELGKLVFARFLDVIERGLVHNSDPKQTYAIGVTSALDWQLRMEFDAAGSRRRSLEEAVGEPEGVNTVVTPRDEQPHHTGTKTHRRRAQHDRRRRLVSSPNKKSPPPPPKRPPPPPKRSPPPPPKRSPPPPPSKRFPPPAPPPRNSKAPPPASSKSNKASIYGALFDLGTAYAPTLDSSKTGTLPMSGASQCNSNTMDNRNALKPAQNQGSCGSCWAFGAAATVMAELYDGSTAPYLSTQELVDCVTSQPKYPGKRRRSRKPPAYRPKLAIPLPLGTTNNGCGGGSHLVTFEYIMNQGVGLDADYPYEMGNSNGVTRHQCRATQDESRRVYISDYKLLRGGEDEMLDEMCINGAKALSIRIVVCSNFENYRGGILTDDCPNDNTKGHLITVVGWGVQSGTPFWIIRNSWGANWGDPAYPGHVRMLRNAHSPNTGNNGLAFLAQMPVRVYPKHRTNPGPAPGPDQKDCRGSSAWKAGEQQAKDGTEAGYVWAVAVPTSDCSAAVVATNYDTLGAAEDAAAAACSNYNPKSKCQVVASGTVGGKPGPAPDYSPDYNPDYNPGPGPTPSPDYDPDYSPGPGPAPTPSPDYDPDYNPGPGPAPDYAPDDNPGPAPDYDYNSRR
ncbi:hypothetical protein HYH03_017794 [Edaphochlamys debaryana]|uniref:Peptidase C1A papain C-terminal domain-containing protein n=1 Tax=Edaphochlamys debaryana TaxID=47281 RepID=A0A835XGL1_9CHLO|nr:hypothetical protein HYH03_017794 [Edaphochlamys debaryana]|eukprot:KAG2483346.1 hypothetical protein HYH03_017794 [Edaphochlamys debaryana]